MLRFLAKARKERLQTKVASAPHGKRAYAVGDIHGRRDLLDKLLIQIEKDIRSRPEMENHIVFLGDLIDRGSASRQVIERLLSYTPPSAKCHFIKGNHEDVLVRGLSGEPNLLDGWLQHGGFATAESYGVDAYYLKNQGFEALEHALISAVPKNHLAFMASFADCIEFGDYLFVHAGVRPGIKIHDQSTKDMLWIRKDFLESEADFGKTIVHGHSVEPIPKVRPNRIGIDTGAYQTGVLSAVRLECSDVEFMQVHANQA